MQDELDISALWGDDWVQQNVDDEAQQDLLQRWSKYERPVAHKPNLVRIDEDASLALVQHPQKKTFAILWRSLKDRVDLGGGRTFLDFQIVAIKPMASGAEATAWLRDVRNAIDFKVARDIDGFGASPEDVGETEEDLAAAVEGF